MLCGLLLPLSKELVLLLTMLILQVFNLLLQLIYDLVSTCQLSLNAPSVLLTALFLVLLCIDLLLRFLRLLNEQSVLFLKLLHVLHHQW